MSDCDPFPDYDSAQYSVNDECAQGTKSRKRSGKLTREGERRKKARYRERHRSAYNAYQRNLMRARKSPDL